MFVGHQFHSTSTFSFIINHIKAYVRKLNGETDTATLLKAIYIGATFWLNSSDGIFLSQIKEGSNRAKDLSSEKYYKTNKDLRRCSIHVAVAIFNQ